VRHTTIAAFPVLVLAGPALAEARWGYIDTTGRVVIKPQFRIAEEFHCGRARVLPQSRGATASKAVLPAQRHCEDSARSGSPGTRPWRDPASCCRAIRASSLAHSGVIRHSGFVIGISSRPVLRTE
jgi:hypothetical protein